MCILLSACNNTIPAADPSFPKKEDKTETVKTTKEASDEEPENKTQILNDISLQTEGSVEVYRAFLSYDDGSLVPSTNVTSLGKPIFLNLNVTKGWKENDGKVSLGASEKISTDNGAVLLNEEDLFKDYASLNADDAKFIRMKAVVNSMTGPINYFVVDYKVWDKNGNGVISGSYKFYIQ